MSFEKICILHLNQIGDLVFSLPLLKALKEQHPRAVVHSVVKPYLEELLADCPWVDRIFVRKTGFRNKVKLAWELRRNRYDLLVSLSRSHECLITASLSRAACKAGFPRFPWRWFFPIRETVEGHNSWRNNAKLLDRLHVPMEKQDYVGLLQMNETTGDLDLPASYAVVSPAASSRRMSKAWVEERFAKVMEYLYRRYGLISVLVGSRDNSDYNGGIIQCLKGVSGEDEMPCVDLTGQIGLRKLCAVLKGSQLFLGIDSGVLHLASALDIPLAGLYGPTDPYYVGPLNEKSVVVQQKELSCVPCYLKKCSHRKCMQELPVEQVLNACDQLLGGGSERE